MDKSYLCYMFYKIALIWKPLAKYLGIGHCLLVTLYIIGTQVVSYKGPGPGVGVQRYRLVLYKQEEKIEKIKNINILVCRGCLKTVDFAGIHKLGDPVGVTYFNVRKKPPPPAKKKTWACQHKIYMPFSLCVLWMLLNSGYYVMVIIITIIYVINA